MRAKRIFQINKTWIAVCLLGQLFLAGAQGVPGDPLLMTQRWRDLFSNYSPLSNPAFLTQENYITARGAFAPLTGNSQMWEMGLTVPIGLYQSAGISWIGENAAIDTLAQAGTATSTFLENYIMGTYAINPWKGLSVGINANLALQNAFGLQ